TATDIVSVFLSRRRHTIFSRDWSSDVCSSDLVAPERRHPAPDQFPDRLHPPTPAPAAQRIPATASLTAAIPRGTAPCAPAPATVTDIISGPAPWPWPSSPRSAGPDNYR